MRNRHLTVRSWLPVLVMMLLFAGCDHTTVFHHYENISQDGWGRSDTLRFEIPPISTDGNYLATLELRTNSTYPYTNLSIIVESDLQPHSQHFSDTLRCSLTDQRGNITGKGISQYQYRFPLATRHLTQGQILTFSVYHNMRRETLPGIIDIGLHIQKTDGR